MLTTKNTTVSKTSPGDRASERSAMRTGAVPRRAAHSSRRRAGASSRAAATPRTNRTSAGSRRRSTPVPPPSVSADVSALPRASARSTAASAPSAATSATPSRRPPNEIESARSAASMAAAVNPARAIPIQSVRSVRIEWATTGPPGEPRWRASSAPAPVPSSQPARLATSVIPTTSVAPTRKICERRAPAHVSRCRTFRWSRRSRVAAEDQQTFAGDAARRADRRDRVGRRGDREDVRLLLESCLRALEPRVEACELPVVDRTWRNRDDPAVRARDQRRVRQRRALEAEDAVGKQDRRSLLAAAAEVRRERRARRERCTADDMEERQLRGRWGAADLDQLAARRRARARQASAPNVEPAREPVDGAEVDERSAPRRLAEHDHPERRLPEDRLHRAAREPVELRVCEVGLRGYAAPYGLDRAVGRLQLGERALDGPVLHRCAPDGGHGQNGRADCDARGNDECLRRVRPEPERRVADRHQQALTRRVPATARPAGCGCGRHSPHPGRPVHRRQRLGGCTSGALPTMFTVLTTNQKGAIAETAIALEAIKLGIGVYHSYADERYDLIFDVGRELLRIQCKWAAWHGDVVVVRLYSNRRGPSGPGAATSSRQSSPDIERCGSASAPPRTTRSRVCGGRGTTNSPLQLDASG